MSSSNSSRKNLSSLAQAALALDDDFKELDRLASVIHDLSIHSESNFEHAQKLMAKFTECGLRVGENIQLLAKSLDESRHQAEQAAARVSARAEVLRKWQESNGTLLDKFQALGEAARDMTATLARFSALADPNVSAEEKKAIGAELPALDKQLESLAEQAWRLRDEGREAGQKKLERDAESMAQSLGSARRRLMGLLGIDETHAVAES